MTNVLHVSSTFLGGYPGRLSKLLNLPESKFRSRFIVSTIENQKTRLDVDLRADEMARDEIEDRIKWADIIHFHGFNSMGVLEQWGLSLPKNKNSILQIYEFPEEGIPQDSPHLSIPAGLPYIITPGCHWNRWVTASFLAPEVPHFYEKKPNMNRVWPFVSLDTRFLPEVIGYREIIKPLKEMEHEKRIMFSPISTTDHNKNTLLKQGADVAIGDIIYGKYNLSSLDYAAAGVACFCRINSSTRENIQKLTGTSDLPWITTDKDRFLVGLDRVIDRRLWLEQGERSKKWMDEHWNAQSILNHYTEAYLSL